ncbi:DUF523 domain-containing protein [Paludibacter jiangxiensis]|uniref:Uncharacterized protein n=1 Tax=Paludibacter jiangxiensis TaxID=681398 RepID=A0A171A0Q4_9BACT|nr:DUF523 domain-containing protein [Paludibacter jiangxiensis]GAT63191.1 hypothetical protein PJIAN_3506 [Paludibacter jiangxiensis]
MKLCSACLLGLACRYNGESVPPEKVLRLAKEEVLIPVCPEQMGGLSTPRPAVELKNGRAVTADGEDVTENFEAGARQVLEIARLYGIDTIILKQRSPSCGCGQVYDGTFSGSVVPGNGITAKLLLENGVKVLTEEDL